MAFAIDPVSIAIGALLGSIIAASLVKAMSGGIKARLDYAETERQRLEGEVDSLQAANTQLEVEKLRDELDALRAAQTS